MLRTLKKILSKGLARKLCLDGCNWGQNIPSIFEHKTTAIKLPKNFLVGFATILHITLVIAGGGQGAAP